MADDIHPIEPPVEPVERPKFSWKRIAKTILAIVIIAGLCGGIYFLANVRKVKVGFASMVFDRQEHYFSCDQLPFLPEVQKAMANHNDIVDKIKALGGSVASEEIKCPTVDNTYYFIKGDMVIKYGSRQQREAIQKQIGDNFFGIPWRGYKA